MIDDLGKIPEHEPLALKPLILPTRSRLYHLAPIGVGTANVESITSYITRLAEAHCVTPTRLIEMEMYPLFYPSSGTGQCGRGDSSVLAKSLNGVATQNNNRIQVIESLTLRTDLRSLTMLPYQNVLSDLKLLRHTKAWCPYCLDEFAVNGTGLYEPLLWTLQSVQACVRHGIHLVISCPHDGCNRSIPITIWGGRIGHCPYCGGRLGLSYGSLSNNIRSLQESEFERQTWLVSNVGDMLAATATFSSFPARSVITQILLAYVEHLTAGRPKALAKHLSVNCRIIYDYLRGRAKPTLDTLLKICFGLRTTPLDLLFGRSAVTEFTPLPSKRKKAAESTPVAELPDRAHILNALQSALANNATPPLRLANVARDLHMTVTGLRKLFPKECGALTSRKINHTRKSHEAIRRVLENALVSDQIPRPSLKDIARDLGLDCATLYNVYPELSTAIAVQYKNYKGLVQIERRQVLEVAVHSPDSIPPSLKEIAADLGCSVKALRGSFSDLCVAINRRRKAYETAVKYEQIKLVLMEFVQGKEIPPSVDEIAKELKTNEVALRRNYPDLCNAVAARRAEHRRMVHEENQHRERQEIRRIVSQFRENGLYPYPRMVREAEIGPRSLPFPEWMQAWQEANREQIAAQLSNTP